MRTLQKAFIVAGCRTPISSYGGAPSGVAPQDLGALVLGETLSRGGLAENDASNPYGRIKEGSLKIPVNTVVLGNVLGAGHGMNLARQSALRSGLAVSTTAYTVNMVCGSALHAVGLAAMHVATGEADVVLAGGVESMSQAAYVSLTQRFGARMGHTELKDLMIQDGLTDAFHSCHMGITAENLAARYSISREAQDAYALESQRRAATAQSQSLFADEIVKVPQVKKGKTVGHVDKDEYPRSDTTLEKLAALTPAFKKDGTVTAGNASGINDGAAAVLVISEQTATRLKLKPIAEIEACTRSGVEPEIMGMGPVGAVERLLEQTGSSIGQFDWIEANEAFAVQALAVGKQLGWASEKVNPSGGAIALGHPIGASGARVLVTLLSQLSRTQKKRGLATLCVGGGQGVAMSVRML